MDFRQSTTTHAGFAVVLRRLIAIAPMLVFGASVIGAIAIAAPPSPSPDAAASASASAAATASVTSKAAAGTISLATGTHLPDGPAVIAFLSQVIGWYRHLPLEEGLVTDPADMLFVANDRQMADEVLDLSFESAKADTALLAAIERGTSPDDAKHRLVPGTEALAASAAKSDAEIKAAQDRLNALQDQMAKASPRKRSQLEPLLAAAQSELDLAEARGEAVHSILQFESGNVHQEAGGNAAGLAGQIEELEKSIPEAERNAKPPAALSPAPQPAAAGGLAGIFEELLTLQRNAATLDDTIEQTNTLAQSVDAMRAPLVTGFT